MIEYQYLNIECDNCETPYEVRWDVEHPSAPLTCPFCGHELEDEAFIDEEDKSDWD
jgi:ribosomal protein S27E|tara:strand:- start:626 stop:793 length:168 start_codon:yes stop_codon:yes gene_type:complete